MSTTPIYEKPSQTQNGMVHPHQHHQPHDQRVRVTDIEMRFGSMVVFMLKWAIASIPAAIVLSVLLTLAGALFMIVMAALGSALR